MMLESGYWEPLFIKEPQTVTEKLQESIVALLRANHEVGIIGGYCEKGLPISLISELTVKMLGYDSSEEFEAAANNSMTALLYENELTEEKFFALFRFDRNISPLQERLTLGKNSQKGY